LVGLTFILNSWNCLETKFTKQESKKKKDSSKLKVVRSALSFFVMLNRGPIRELNPHFGCREVKKICSDKFAALDVNGKKKYAARHARRGQKALRPEETSIRHQ
jgi:hypothetical protein